jgi:hypothetical protein
MGPPGSVQNELRAEVKAKRIRRTQLDMMYGLLYYQTFVYCFLKGTERDVDSLSDGG